MTVLGVRSKMYLVISGIYLYVYTSISNHLDHCRIQQHLKPEEGGRKEWGKFIIEKLRS